MKYNGITLEAILWITQGGYYQNVRGAIRKYRRVGNMTMVKALQLYLQDERN